MSHFTHIKTHFHNFFYLEKALNQLNLVYKKKSADQSLNINLIIPRSNREDIEFSWNGQEYELVVDKSFWNQSCSTKNFLNQIARQYASEVVIGESIKIGFQPTKCQKNLDGSNTLFLERFRLI